MWMSWLFLLLSVLLLLAAPVGTGTAESMDTGSNCQLKCGDMDIRYPFGIGPDCFRPGFEIICDNEGSGGEVKAKAANDKRPEPLHCAERIRDAEARSYGEAAGDLAVLQLHW
jgi:hypothetical protein